MRGLVFVDTSAWYALFSRTDRSHGAIRKAFAEARTARVTLVTSHDIFRGHADQDLSFTDCTSAALMRARGIDAVLTLDAHFRMLGFSVLPVA